MLSSEIAITTVGYGEITPVSFLGRLFTLPLLIFGLLFIALPSFVLGREFSIVWEKMTSKDQHHQVRVIFSVPALRLWSTTVHYFSIVISTTIFSAHQLSAGHSSPQQAYQVACQTAVAVAVTPQEGLEGEI
jgi:magnesium-transporting ATPase (P-type)